MNDVRQRSRSEGSTLKKQPDRTLRQAVTAFPVTAVVIWPLLMLVVGKGHINLAALSDLRIQSDWPLVVLGLAVPAVLSIAVYLWATRMKQMRANQQKLHEELSRSNSELTVLRKRIDHVISEKEQVNELLSRTTTKVRIQLTRLLQSSRTRRQGPELSDCIDDERWKGFQIVLAEALGVAVALNDSSGGQILHCQNTSMTCQLIQDSTLGKQECFWFQRELGEKAAHQSKPVYKFCTACGLMCGAVPLVVAQKHLATWIVGQVRIESASEPDLADIAIRCGIPQDKLSASLQSTRMMTLNEFELMLASVWHLTEETAERCRLTWQLSGIVMDRREVEKQLRLVWHALDNCDTAFVFLGSNKECLNANKAARELLGYDENALKNKRVDEFLQMECLEQMFSGENHVPSEYSANIVSLQKKEAPLRVAPRQVLIGGKKQTYLILRPGGIASDDTDIDVCESKAMRVSC